MYIVAIKHTVTGLYFCNGQWCEEPEWFSENAEINMVEKMVRSDNKLELIERRASYSEYQA
jgi:hypothetical protein